MGYYKCMQFADFAKYLKTLEETPSRLAMTEQLANLFKELELSEVKPVCYLLQGTLVPQYESLEFNLSVKMVLRALDRLNDSFQAEEATNLFGESISRHKNGGTQTLYKELGDVGLVAETIITDRHESVRDTTKVSAELISVFFFFLFLAKENGEG